MLDRRCVPCAYDGVLCTLPSGGASPVAHGTNKPDSTEGRLRHDHIMMRALLVVCSALLAVAAAVRVHSEPFAVTTSDARHPIRLSLTEDTASRPTSLWGGLRSFLTLRSPTTEQVVRVPSL
jgi:hypothetical protein